jgi:hypothetical protein
VLQLQGSSDAAFLTAGLSDARMPYPVLLPFVFPVGVRKPE